MNLWVGITDGEWHDLLRRQPDLDGVNFWQPGGGGRAFRALAPGDPFLFKLHAPRHVIVGGGFFAHWTSLPVSLAWEAFGIGNGATTLSEMRARIEKYRKTQPAPHEDYTIGCILLDGPFFLPEELWIPAPPDWKPNIVQGKTYTADTEVGRALFDRLRLALAAIRPTTTADRSPDPPSAPGERYGDPILIRPRRGQGTFRVLVTDAYERRCAVTREKTLPVLEAAHIRPYGEGGEHRVDNGLLLRRDLHTLFDRGYVTVAPEGKGVGAGIGADSGAERYRFEVSRRLKDDWENGREYYALHGRELWVPGRDVERPSAEWLRWHNEERFLG